MKEGDIWYSNRSIPGVVIRNQSYSRVDIMKYSDNLVWNAIKWW